MKIGFIGLGNVGGKLAGSLLRNKFDLTVRDLDEKISKSFIDKGSYSLSRRSEPPKLNKKKEQGAELDTEIGELLALFTFR